VGIPSGKEETSYSYQVGDPEHGSEKFHVPKT